MSTSSGQATEAIATLPPLLLWRPALMERSALSVSIFFEQPASARAMGTVATTASRRRIRGGHVSRGAVGPKARGRHSVGPSDRIAGTPARRALRSAERRAAVAAPAGRGGLAAADEAARAAAQREVLDRRDDALVQRGVVAARGGEQALGECRRRHVTLRSTPTTRPSTRTSFERIGSRASFSGCSRMWSDSRKKRLTVASSPTRATTI